VPSADLIGIYLVFPLNEPLAEVVPTGSAPIGVAFVAILLLRN
jgi:hypothetical protein